MNRSRKHFQMREKAKDKKKIQDWSEGFGAKISQNQLDGDPGPIPEIEILLQCDEQV